MDARYTQGKTKQNEIPDILSYWVTVPNKDLFTGHSTTPCALPGTISIITSLRRMKGRLNGLL